MMNSWKLKSKVFCRGTFTLWMSLAAQVRRNFILYRPRQCFTYTPGYTLSHLDENEFGLTAQLNLAGKPCNAFGNDILNLSIEITYETITRYALQFIMSSVALTIFHWTYYRLHVHIYDTANKQFRIPESIISRPPPPTTSYTKSSDLIFNYESNPFAFWITRRSNINAKPLFDTRPTSLPRTPIPPFNASDSSTAFNGFQLVFEDQYLQVMFLLWSHNASFWGAHFCFYVFAHVIM